MTVWLSSKSMVSSKSLSLSWQPYVMAVVQIPYVMAIGFCIQNISYFCWMVQSSYHMISSWIKIWLVVYLPLWKIWKSVGIIIPNIWKVIKFMFQTTNQQMIYPLAISHMACWTIPERLPWKNCQCPFAQCSKTLLVHGEFGDYTNQEIYIYIHMYTQIWIWINIYIYICIGDVHNPWAANPVPPRHQDVDVLPGDSLNDLSSLARHVPRHGVWMGS